MNRSFPVHEIFALTGFDPCLTLMLAEGLTIEFSSKEHITFPRACYNQNQDARNVYYMYDNMIYKDRPSDGWRSA